MKLVFIRKGNIFSFQSTFVFIVIGLVNNLIKSPQIETEKTLKIVSRNRKSNGKLETSDKIMFATENK